MSASPLMYISPTTTTSIALFIHWIPCGMVKGKLSFHLSDLHTVEYGRAYEIVYTFRNQASQPFYFSLPKSFSQRKLCCLLLSLQLSVSQTTPKRMLRLYTNLMNYYKLQLRTNYSLLPENHTCNTQTHY